MSETPKQKKAAKPKQPATHPKYSQMIQDAISKLKERSGSSRQAILKYILANYNVGSDGKIVNNHLKMALKAGVKNKTLKQSKGTGASGSFRIGEVKKEKKVKKPKAAKPKAKKPAAKKPAAKKQAGEKAKKVKTPKKKAASKPKKSPAKKAPKPKKSPAKKAAKKTKSPKKAEKKWTKITGQKL